MAINFKTLCSNLVAVGRYKVQVTDMKFAAGGSKNILVNFTFVEGPYAKRTHTETISEKAYSFRLLPLLKACKVDVEREFATAEELCKFGFANAKGKIIEIDMGIRTYNGQDYNNITDFYPLTDSSVSTEDVAAAFNENPVVKADPLKDIAIEDVPGTEEPKLEVDLDLGDDSPF